MLAVIVVGIFACGGSDAADAVLDKADTYRVAVCACQDLACGQARSAEYQAWLKIGEPELGRAEPSDKQWARSQQIDKSLHDCMGRLFDQRYVPRRPR